MEKFGIRELKRRTGEIIRRVRELGEIYAITYRGRVVARVVPVAEVQQEAISTVWATMDQLALEISAKWPSNLSATDAVAGQRRSL